MEHKYLKDKFSSKDQEGFGVNVEGAEDNHITHSQAWNWIL